ncbi:MAG: amino acid adenylation domain-containing protein [Gemmatimonadaceae bacterium]
MTTDRAAAGGVPLDAVDFRSLRTGFLAHAASHPADVALVVGDVTRTYGELALTARRWAGAILAAVPRRVERVGVFAYRSEVAYAGVLAALCAGATYVPLNRTFPPARTRAMLRRAALDAVIVDRASAPQLAAVLEGVESPPLLVVPEAEARAAVPEGAALLDADAIARAVPAEVLPPVLPDDVAYLLFTSGTTGEPKGVGVTQGNALHFLDVMQRRYALHREDRVSQTFDQTFDLSVFDMFMAWNAGARLCVPRPIELLAPAAFVAKHGLTVWFSVPSVVALMRKKGLLRAGAMPTLRWSLFCGEPLPRRSAEEWLAAAPGSTVENLYGPTELTIACFVYRWDPARSPALCVRDLVPIGRPLPGLGALLVDDALRPVAAGEQGELCVCGPQTVPGYWQDPARTAERFVELPVSPRLTKRFYRTGDRVVAIADSPPDAPEYAYLGRVDHQIKVLGFRVELGEIEAAVARFPEVVEAAAVGWPVEEGRALGTVAFVTTGGAVDATALLRELKGALPDYMVPREIVVLERFPLNANGKTDRAALAALLDERAAVGSAAALAAGAGGGPAPAA